MLDLNRLKYILKVGNDTGKQFGWIANTKCSEKCPSNCRDSTWMYWQGQTGGRGSWVTDNTLKVDGIYMIQYYYT